MNIIEKDKEQYCTSGPLRRHNYLKEGFYLFYTKCVNCGRLNILQIKKGIRVCDVEFECFYCGIKQRV